MSLRDIIRPGETSGLDFVKEEELNKRTGITRSDVLAFTLSETLCNALDKSDTTQIFVDIKREGQFDFISVSDNGSRRIEKADLELILDFENKASSKRGLRQISRGMLGNALKSIFGYSFALSEDKGLVEPSITVESGKFQYKTKLKPDIVNQKIDHEPIDTIERLDNGLTTITVGFPSEKTIDELKIVLKNKIIGTSMVNPCRIINYNIYGEEGVLGTAEETTVGEVETVISWYNLKKFTELAEDYIRVRPEIKVKDYIALFKWFSRQLAIKDILFELNRRNLDSQNGRHMQFVPSTPLKNFSRQDMVQLLEIMKTQSKPINKRSTPNLLGHVGEHSFERIQQQHGWPKLRYIRLCGMNISCPEHWHTGPCRNLDHVESPYLVELAIFDRNDTEGLKVHQAVNFMDSSHDLLHSMFNLQFRLGRVGITESSSITIVAHVVSPIPPWTNYGKTALGNIDSEELLEKAFDKLLPVPKTPREYRPPPPPRPLSWVPHGEFHAPEYRKTLAIFAEEIKAIDRQSSFHVRPRMRGWGYRLESLGKIDKGQFDALANAINDCRKIGLLPMNIISPDPDTSRHFQGIHRATTPNTILDQFRNGVKEMLDILPSNITDFYAGEKYYVIMVVEKGEVLSLFGLVCRDYFVPYVSSKGWSNLEIRANIAAQCKWALEYRLIPVLLLFYDMDPKGEEIPDTFRKNLKDMEEATGWNPNNMIIERFGLTDEQIVRFRLSWVNNLQTSSGREAKSTRKVIAYIQRHGERKCEMESLYKDDETTRAAEQICREAIEKYLGCDAKERFRKKEEESKAKLSIVYDSPVWKQLNDELARIEKTLEEQEPKSELTATSVQEVEVVIDNKYYGRCPKCGRSFDYSENDIGRLVRCRRCHVQMRLKLAQ